MENNFKYRGWSENLCKWLYGSLVTGLFENTKTKEQCFQIIDPTINSNYDCLSDFDDSDFDVVGISVGQSTLLIDKNGVEVFSGDINHKGEVIKWNSKSSSYGWFDRKGRCLSYPIYISDSFEIIGNIFENDELIK